MDDLVDRFHQHLDKCEQCKNNPFDLCEEGQLIMGSSLPEKKTNLPVEEAKKDLDRYWKAMSKNQVDICVEIEKKYLLFGLSPDLVTQELSEIIKLGDAYWNQHDELEEWDHYDELIVGE